MEGVWRGGGGFQATNFILVYTATIFLCLGSNSNAALNQRPPFSISQPRSSTPTHNVTSSAGHSMQGSPLQMMPMSSSVSPNQQQQMANYCMPIPQFASSGMMNLPYPGMGHMGGPLPLYMPQQLGPTSHGVMTGPLRMGMPNRHAMMPPNMSHHGGMVHPGMGVGGMVPHQNMVRGARGQMQIGPHQHPAGHPAVHGHHMASGGVPTQLQVGRPNMGRPNMGRPNMGRHMIPRGRPLDAQPNVMGQRFSDMGVPRPHVPWVPPTTHQQPVTNSAASMDCILPGNLQCLIGCIIIISGSASTLTT